MAAKTELDLKLGAETRQAEQSGLRKLFNQLLHQVHQAALRDTAYTYCTLAFGPATISEPGIEHPGRHRMRHVGKARHEVMTIDAETGDAVVRVGDQITARRQLRHFDPVGVGIGAEAALDLGYGTRVQGQRHTGGTRRAGARVIVRCRPDAAAAEHRDTLAHRAREFTDQVIRVVRQDTQPRNLEAAFAQHAADALEVAVTTPAVEDLVTDNDDTEGIACRRPVHQIAFLRPSDSGYGSRYHCWSM